MYLETSDRRSLFHDRSRPKNCFLSEGPVRKDSAACVSLSSYSLVKQPGSEACPHPSVARRAVEARHPRTVGWRFTVPVRSFKGASSRRNAVAGADGPYIGGGPIRCQRENRKFFGTHFRRRANSREATRNGRDLCANRHLVSPEQTSMPHRSHIRGTSYRTNFPRG